MQLRENPGDAVGPDLGLLRSRGRNGRTQEAGPSPLQVPRRSRSADAAPPSPLPSFSCSSRFLCCLLHKFLILESLHAEDLEVHSNSGQGNVEGEHQKVRIAMYQLATSSCKHVRGKIKRGVPFRTTYLSGCPRMLPALPTIEDTTSAAARVLEHVSTN